MDRKEKLSQFRNIVPNDSAFANYLLTGGFFTAPASTKYHGVYPGGLFDHSWAVMETLVDLTKKNGLEWQRPESPVIVGLFHDLCKCDQYKLVKGTNVKPVSETVSENGIRCVRFGPDDHYEYNDSMLLKGHGDKSVMILSQFMPLTEEEVLCIRYHMGAYEKDDWQGFDLAIRKYPNVLWTHHADMIASKVLGT